MRAAGLAETPDQNVIGRFEKNHLGRNQASDCLQNLGKLFQLRSFPNVHDQRGAANLTRLHG
jgi:hypothetical protein